MPDPHPLVSIAHDAIAAFTARRAYRPPALPPELRGIARPVFVSLHDPRGHLRGCVGHLRATCDNLADEVATTAVLAAGQDERFPPVEAREVPGLRIEVSVLGPTEPLPGGDVRLLDPRRYGVVVSRGHRRGVLLPDLPGVDTVDQQLSIARQKAGILPDDPVTIERFEVEEYR